ncbi:YCII-related domain-containing protein [Marivirga sericea]|uniref:YCII-related domain-containing protein n=1 Tax=Marivirga sericea TaxID=1028 RepID=A0A1X7J9K7_9BACT|nr:YciI family protein [Marivirga sericea]SMG24497.1 YCII-related domain-containing protein [Marivirga sericea]
MKTTLLHCIFLIIPFLGFSQNPNYDKSLADSLGADDYGMKSYSLVMLKSGGGNIEDKSKVDSLFRGHLDNIGRLAKEGKIIVAGPVEKNDRNYRGIFIFDVQDKAKVAELLQTDPAIKADLLAYDIYNWYGSAALSVYLETHSKIEKIRP